MANRTSIKVVFIKIIRRKVNYLSSSLSTTHSLQEEKLELMESFEIKRTSLKQSTLFKLENRIPKSFLRYTDRLYSNFIYMFHHNL